MARATFLPGRRATVERTGRQQDGAVYKTMGWVAVSLLVFLPLLGAAFAHHIRLTTGLALIPLGTLIFDVGWDLALRATGRGDMLVETEIAPILATGLRSAAYVGITVIVVDYVTEDPSRWPLVGISLLAWIATDVVAGVSRR